MKNRWVDSEAAQCKGVDQVVYRSRLIGQETSLVVWGGGNTSMKHPERDFRGQEIPVLRVKGSGLDLKSIRPKDFPGIRLNDVLPLYHRVSMRDEEMVAYLVHCLIEPNSPRPSIETLLHAFVPYAHIDHTHADAILALTNNQKGISAVREVFGNRVAWVGYRRPGFALSKEVADVVRSNDSLQGIVLEKHGLITWGNQSKESYSRTIALISEAQEYLKARRKGKKVFGAMLLKTSSHAERVQKASALMPVIRGAVGKGKGVVLHFDDANDIMEFVDSAKAKTMSQIGPATPDHQISTKPRPLYIGPTKIKDPTTLKRTLLLGLEKYKQGYMDFFQRNKIEGVSMLDPWPSVILIAGVGMITLGKDKRTARIPAEIYHHTISVMANATGIAPYESLNEKDTYDVDYWPMELYKLTLAPPPQEFSGKIVFITGAGSGIGRATALRFAKEGAHVVATDIHTQGLEEVRKEIETSIAPQRCLALKVDVTNPSAVRNAFRQTILEFGGLDVVVSNAGIAHVASIESLKREDWQKNLDVNASAHFYVAQEALQIFKEQNLGGNIIFVASKNVLAPGKDFGAYSASKAAQTQLARILAIENGQYGIRVNIVNPDAVFKDSKLWSQEIRKERAKAHGIRQGELENFYMQRNLLKTDVTANDVAESILFLASARSAKTTGCILTVDGGVKEAFPR